MTTPKRERRPRVTRNMLEPHAQQAYDLLPPKGSEHLFGTLLLAFAHRNEIAIGKFGDSNVADLIKDLAAHGHSDPESSANCCIDAFNTFIAPGLGLTPLTRLPTKQSEYLAWWAAKPPAIREAIDAYIASLPHIKDRSRVINANFLRQVVAMLAEGGRALNAPRDLVSPEAIDFIAFHPSFGGFEAPSRVRKSFLGLQKDLARHLGFSDCEAHAEQRLGALASQKTGRAETEIGLELIDRLDAFDEVAAFGRLVGKLGGHVEIFASGSAPRRTAHPNARDALGALIVLSTCVDRADLIKLRFAEEEFRYGEKGRRPLLVLPTDAQFESKLSEPLRVLIDRFYRAAQRQLDRKPRFLFELLDGTAADGSTIGKKIAEIVEREAVRFSPEELKIVATTWIVSTYPKTPKEGVAGLLGFKTTRAFVRRYRPLLAANACRRFVECAGLTKEVLNAR